MRWLYANYIKPQLQTADNTGYETPLSLMETALEPDLRKHFERTMELCASNAFLLGFRTGIGLGKSLKE